MKHRMTELYRGCMRGRTMYVIPFCMGPLDAEQPMFGVEITDSAYVVASMRIMTRMGSGVLQAMGDDADFVPALHSVGRAARARSARRGLAVQRDQVHLPLPGDPRDLVVRLRLRRQLAAGQEVLLAAHRQRDGPRRGLAGRAHADPQADLAGERVHYIAAAFPSACGKTNLAMLEPTIPGWKVETLGDDIAWMRFGDDGRLYAVNPEYGLFGVAPGTDWKTNPNAMRTLAKGNSIFTNVARTDDGDVWWEGMGEPPAHLTRLARRRLDARRRRAVQPPELALLHADHAVPDPRPRVRRPERRADLGDPVRRPARKTTIPLVTEARDWVHGVYMGATLSSETTAAAVGAGRRGPPRPDGDAAVHRLPRR